MSSYFDDSSLVFIPSGYKTSKAYSVKPIDGTGDLTFTRSNSTATRVNSAGLIERVRTNLQAYSQDFRNVAEGGATNTWTPNDTVILSTNNEAPDGTLTATRIRGTSGANKARQAVITGTAGAPYSGSFFIRRVSGTQNITLRVGDVGTAIGINPTSTWQRFSYTASPSTTTVRLGLVFPNDTDEFEIWGAQLETGDIATNYIPTTTAAVSVGPVANVPRLDYLNSSCPRLLLEPQRTNIATYSEQFDNAAYVKTNNTITANATTSPDGYTNADKVIPTTTNGFHSLDILPSVIVTTYTLSVFAKAGEYSKIALLTNNRGSNMARGFDLINGTTFANDFGYSEPTSFSIENYGNGWYRCSITYPKTSTGTSGNGVAVINDSGASTFAGNGTNGLFLYGFQMESGASYVSSYIPTLGAAVTRGADDASKTGISSLIGQTEGTVFVEVDYSTLSGLDMFLSIRPNASNKVEVYRDGGTIYGEITASGSFALSASKAVGTHKIAFAYKSGSSALYIDGVLAGQSTTAFTYSATLADLFINQRSGGTFIEAANYKQALLFKTRLTNAQLAELTTL